jgi:peptide/nickel transport system substrate-binding protein
MSKSDSNAITRRELLRQAGLFTAAVPAAALLAACVPSGSVSPAASSSAATVVKGGHVTQGIVGSFSRINPFYVGGQNPGLNAWQILYEMVYGPKANGEFEPILAQSAPTVSTDQKTVTIKLRSGMKWTDGQPLTAEDVAFTYQVLYDPKWSKVPHGKRGRSPAFIDSVRATDPTTVTILLKSPWAALINTIGDVTIAPKHIFGNMTPEQITTWNETPSVTSGPFKFERWDKGQQVSLIKNDASFRAPNIDRYIIREFGNSDALLAALQTGEVDWAIIDPSVVDLIRNAGKSDVLAFPDKRFLTYFHQLDPAKPASKLFGDVRVRQALMYALDREAMAKAIYLGYAKPSQSVIGPIFEWAHNPNVTPKYAFDKAKAESLLDEAGWKRGASGTRERDGTPFRFDFKAQAGDRLQEKIVASLQEQWRAIGVELTPRLTDGAGVVDEWQNKHNQDMLMVNAIHLTDPDLSRFLSSADAIPGSYNSASYKNPEVDQILNEALATVDRAKRKELYSRLQNIIARDLPMAPLFDPQMVVAVNKRLKGPAAAFDTFSYDKSWWTDRFWVTDAK